MKILTKTILGILATVGLLTIGLNIIGIPTADCQVSPLRATTAPSGNRFAKLQLRSCIIEEDSGVHLLIGQESEGSISSVKLFGTTSTDFELSWRSDSALDVITPEVIEASRLPYELKGVEIRIVHRPRTE